MLKRTPLLPLATLLLALHGAPAAATIMAGATMVEPPAMLGPDPFGETAFLAFYEPQNVTLDRTIRVGGRRLEAGTVIASHYILYDPDSMALASAEISFDSEILAVVGTRRGLRRSDFLGLAGVDYRSFPHRGREWRDSFRIGEDGRSIRFRHRAHRPGDYVRVITAYSPGAEPPPPPPPPPPPSPVPEPGALLLFGAGALGVQLAARGVRSGSRVRGETPPR